MKWVLLVGVLSVVGSSEVLAQEGELASGAAAIASPSQRTGVALVAAAGLHTGLGLGMRAGTGDIGIEVIGGYQPLVALWEQPQGRDFNVDTGSSGQVLAELYLTPIHPTPSSSIGLKVGYRYNSVLEHGTGFALTFLVDLSQHLALEVAAGAAVFPGAQSRLKAELGVPSDANVVYGSAVQFFEYGFELVWFP